MSFVNQWRDANFFRPLHITMSTLSAMGLGLALTACQPTPETNNQASNTAPSPSNVPEVIIAQTPASIPPATVGLKRMDFPVYLAGVPNLLHPIIPSVPINRKAESDASDAKKSPVSYFQEVAPYDFQSSVYNIVFEGLKTGQVHRLFPHDNFVIRAVHTPLVDLSQENKTAQKKAAITQTAPTQPQAAKEATSPLAVKVGNTLLLGYFIYEVKEIADDDDNKTNLDQQLTLYLSDLNGKNLLKLTPNNQYFKHYKWLPETKRFYFSTQADSNGDRVIDENDKYFYYFIDFTKNAQIVTAYDFSKPKA